MKDKNQHFLRNLHESVREGSRREGERVGGGREGRGSKEIEGKWREKQIRGGRE